jgi:hypothetical protein
MVRPLVPVAQLAAAVPIHTRRHPDGTCILDRTEERPQVAPASEETLGDLPLLSSTRDTTRAESAFSIARWRSSSSYPRLRSPLATTSSRRGEGPLW